MLISYTFIGFLIKSLSIFSSAFIIIPKSLLSKIGKEEPLALLKSLLDLVKFHLFTDHGVSVPVSRTNIDFKPNVWTQDGNDEFEFKIAKSILPKNNSRDVLKRLEEMFPGEDFHSFAEFEETVIVDTSDKYTALVDDFLLQMKDQIRSDQKREEEDNLNEETEDIIFETTTINNEMELKDNLNSFTSVKINNDVSAKELEAYLKISLIVKKLQRNIHHS